MNAQHLKRCFSLLLIMALLITAMPMQVFAAGTANDSENIVEAVSEVPQYTVVFYDTDGTELQTVTVDEGMLPEYEAPTKDPDEYGRYEFAGWDPEVTEAYSDAEYYAVWNSVKQYTVTFKDWDGEVLKEVRVDENTALAETDLPENPEREADAENTYTFIGWDKDVTAAVSENTVITAVYESKDIPVNVTFKTGENGSYTVNGEAVERERVEATTTKTSFSLAAVPADGYDFFGWYDGDDYISEDAEYTFKPLEDMEIRPVFVEAGTVRLAVGDEYFSSFDEAVAAAKKADDKTIVLMNDGVLEAGEYEIPEGVTLLIPYNEEAVVYTTEPECFDETWVKPTPYRTLTLAKGANLTVNGAVSLASPHVPAAGSKENGGSPHKAYGQIVTEAGSTVTVNDGGVLYAYGYITGEGTVEAKSGASVYEYFQIMDFRGGSATTSMITSGYGVLPINQYYVQNIEVPLTLEAGASEYCYTSAKMSGNILSSYVGFIGTGKDAMFKLTSGTMTKYYDGTTDRLMATVNGDMNISPITIDIGNKSVSSDDFVLPINGNITMNIASGSVTITQDVALTPGAELIIGKDAVCTLKDDSNVYVYDAEQWGRYSSSNRNTFVDVNYAPSKEYTRTDADLRDAIIKVEGTLNASRGYVYTTESGADINSTDAGTILLRKGVATTTYQFEYMGTPDTGYDLYGTYHEIAISAAQLRNQDDTYVNQEVYEEDGIVTYEYINGVWTPVGHVIVIDEGYPASCNTPGLEEGQHCNFGESCAEHYIAQVEIEALGHDMKDVAAKAPTYTSIGWNDHKECSRCGEKSEEYQPIDKLEGAVIDNYDMFLENLEILEEWADDYVKANPGKDPAALVIKYIRTGVDRYNSGSWGIMAGYEDKDFAAYVAKREDTYNSEAAENDKELLKVSGLKNLVNFTVPNGDEVDFGHMFGTMDITYNNNFSVNHADVAGWAGDIVDLLSLADQFGTGDATTVNEMADYIYENYLFKETEELEDEFGDKLKEGSFSMVDMIGDLDGYYIMKVLESTEYDPGTLTEIIKSYCTEDLTEEERAEYLLENRFEDKTLRVDLRDEVFSEVVNNKVVNTLEATREFETEDLTDLRKACCYAFADYICQQAGDYVDALENDYMSVFSSTFSTLAPGITQKTYQAKTADGKQMDYFIATADVTREDIQVYANYHNNDPSQGWEMQRVIDQANAAQERYGNPESEEYIENYNVIASINGGGYNMSTGEPSGLLVMRGQTYHPIDGGGFFAILKDGTALIGSQKEYNEIYKDQIEEAIGGFGTTLVKNGKVAITATSDYYTNRASRTAVGITKTGKVVFMVLDGRQGDYSCGGSMEEIAQIMLDAGCEHAINLDGGGSSTFVARQEGEDELSVVNNPSDGISRSVSTSLFVVSTAPSSTAFDHAVLESDYAYLTAGASVQMTASGVSATNNGVDLPEGTTWAVEDETIGTISEDGVFTAKGKGDVDVLLMLEGEVVGRTTLHVVTPDNLYFLRTSANAVYGQTVEIPVKAVYKNKAVAVTANDVVFTLSDEKAGTVDGFNFTASETSNLKNVQITASMPNESSVSAVFTLYLYNQGEASFDFDKATGGDLQFAWDRQISNTVTDDGVTYSIVDQDEEMTTAYSFAIDMSQIEIPEVLADLTYMLPGADIEGASAWTFLCQLAERMSDQTEVKPVIVFDKNVDVDYSDLTLVNDYFDLKGKEFDEETNTLTLTLNWKKQDKPIDVAMANPICILSGIKITPKDDAAWNAKDQLNIVNSGEISYTVYMRASGLYTFSQNSKNQERYGLTPYVHPNNENERGGKFSATYKTFKDSYTLDKSIKNGWVGLRYYENGNMYTGVCPVNGYYHDFGEDGINRGQKKYTGELTVDGKEYYINNGEIFREGCSMWTQKDDGWLRFGDNDWRYYDPETGVREKVTMEENGHTCIVDTVYTFTSETGKVLVIERDDAGGHEYVEDADGTAICSVCGWQRIDMVDVIRSLSYTATTYTGLEKRPYTTAIDPVTGEKMAKSGKYQDYSSRYADNVEVGKATVTFRAFKQGWYVNKNQWRGDYKGSATLNFTIHPDLPTNGVYTLEDGKLKLTWDAAKVAETDTEDNVTTYIIQRSKNGEKWTEVGKTTETSYVVKNFDKYQNHQYRIITSKVGTDGETYTSLKAANVYIAPEITASNVESSGKVKITWEKIGGAKKYIVYRAESKNGEYTAMLSTTGTSYVNSTAKEGNTYYYKVKAVYSDGKGSQFSNTVTRTCDLARPVVTASNVAKTGKVKLTWKKVSGADKYVVYRATSKNGTYKKMFTTTKLSYTNTSAVAGKTYYYKVKAIDKDKVAATSAYSVVDARTCDLARPVVTVKSTEKNKVKLTWKKVSGAKKYVVYRATSKNGTYKAMYSTTKLSYTNITAKSGKTYYYKVKAIAKESSANSAYSLRDKCKCK